MGRRGGGGGGGRGRGGGGRSSRGGGGGGGGRGDAAVAGRGRGKGPRLDSRLLRELNGGRAKKKENSDDEDTLAKDFYEYEEGVAQEESGKNRRYDDVELVEYELPSDFEDEEIDEDAAMGEDDVGLKATVKDDDGSDLESDEGGNLDSDDEGDEEEEDEEDSEEEEEEEEDDDEKHQQMLEAVTGKSQQLRNDGGARDRKRQVRSEAYTESGFNLNPTLNGNASAVSVQEFLGTLKGTSGIQTLQKRTQPLQKEDLAVNAPLPKVIQERVDRKAGYEKSKEEVAKWQPLVKQNREAPSLTFNEREALPTSTVAALADKHKPMTDMEKEVAAILQQSNLVVDADIEAAEALELNKLSVEEVRERQQRLSKMRSLLFQHEAKSKRVAKIKSKTFRRLDKSKKMRDFMETDEEAVKEAALKQEEKRAEERMTLKHKNTSRWAKRILKRGLKAHEDGTRDAIMEQLRAHSMLTKKIQNANSSDSDGSSSSDEEEEDEEGGEGGKGRSKLLSDAKAATFEALQFDEEADAPKTGLFALPFMARAMEKKRNEAREEALAILEQLEQAEADEDGEGGTHEDRETEIGEAGHSGRLAFGELAVASQGQNKKRSRPKKHDHDDYSDLELEADEEGDDDDDDVESDEDTKKRKFQVQQAKKASPKSKPKKSSLEGNSNVDQVNPSKETNEPEDVAGKQKKKKNKKNKKKAKKNGEEKGKETESNGELEDGEGQQTTTTTGVIEVSVFNKEAGFKPAVRNMSSTPSIPDKIVENSTSASLDKIVEKKATAFLDLDDDDDADPGLELVAKAATQEELIRQAFAGDDVEADFQETKSRALDEEIVKVEEATVLPGWGNWTHSQKKKEQPGWKEQLEKKRREEAMKKRKDANLKFVVISERTDKKSAKFHTTKIPFPMKTPEVFEQSLRMPIGREYNGEKVFRDMIRPAELKSAGVIIDPIKFDKSVKRPADTPKTENVKRRRVRPGKAGKGER